MQNLYLFIWLPCFACTVEVGQINTGMGMKCSSRHTLAPIDPIFGGQLPPILPPGVRLVEAHSLQSERRPTPSSLPRNVYSDPEWRPTPFSPSTVYNPLGCRFYFLDTPGVHGVWILTEHSKKQTTTNWFIIKSHRSKILNCVIIYKLQI